MSAVLLKGLLICISFLLLLWNTISQHCRPGEHIWSSSAGGSAFRITKPNPISQQGWVHFLRFRGWIWFQGIQVVNQIHFLWCGPVSQPPCWLSAGPVPPPWDWHIPPRAFLWPFLSKGAQTPPTFPPFQRLLPHSWLLFWLDWLLQLYLQSHFCPVK